MNHFEKKQAQEEKREAQVDQILAGLAALLSGEASVIVDNDRANERKIYSVQSNAG